MPSQQRITKVAKEFLKNMKMGASGQNGCRVTDKVVMNWKA